MSSLMSTLFLFSVLLPTKLWYSPGQPVLINVKAETPIVLTLTDFLGHPIEAKGDAKVDSPKQVDLAKIFPALPGGTYLLSAVPADKSKPFVGTPLVIEIRTDKRAGVGDGPMVWRVEPLRYAVMETDQGSMTMAFYYDAAPNTVDNFLRLADEGFYDGIAFHRIIRGFVLQVGDPLSMDTARAGTGGPGYTIPAEFNRRPHVRGALSMARSQDPDSASSQFFVCLDYNQTQQLDGKYTVFGQVTTGEDTMLKLASVDTTKPGDRPVTPPVIKKLTVKTVTPGDNPYEKLLAGK